MSTIGMLQGRFPFVRFGTGPAPLMVVPGIALDNHMPEEGTSRAYSWALRRLAVGRTITIVRRPRGLAHDALGSAGIDTAEIADAYAAVMRDELGPVDVMALSTGGLIAQHLALGHPHLVRRLVLVVTGTRIAARGRQTCQTWLALTQRHAWRALRGELAAVAVDGPVSVRLARLLGSSGREPDPRDVTDFAATVVAALRHDTTGALDTLTSPTLVLGGRDDPFFPEPVLRATAAQIPDATLRVHAGGHGIPKQHGRWLQNQVAAFLTLPSATGG